MMNIPDPLQDPEFASLVSRLRAQEAPGPSADFTARTVARLHQLPPRHGVFPANPAAVAAGLALLLGAGLWFFRLLPFRPVAEESTPIAILMAAQRADGGWSADDRPARARYDASLTALALLALMQDDSLPSRGREAAAIRAGIAHLLRQQRSDGRFGVDFSGSSFTHYLATMALLAALDRTDAETGWTAAAERALPHLPTKGQMAKLNASLARPELFPARWADVGGPVAHAAIEMLKR